MARSISITPRRSAATAADVNFEAGGQLRDMALIHPSEYGRIAYRRAAQTVLAMEEPLDRFVSGHSLRELPYIGPASERVIREVLANRTSPTVEKAIDASGKRDRIETARRLRSGFISRAKALQTLARRLPGVIRSEDYRGDLQVHSEWSDGRETIPALAEAARKRGYDYLGVTDHSYGLRIAGGMSMEEVGRQHAVIDAFNRSQDGRFRVIKGIEANIPLDGGVDMTDDELARFELVLAAPHSRLRRAEDQTARMLAAVRHPGVHILAHPRGRMMTRAGVQADWGKVFAEAKRRNVAIEIDGDPFRQDLDQSLARQALAAGCLFALDSDAHSGPELAYTDIALAHARLAGIPAERVINTWPVDRLLAWAKRTPPSKRTRVKRQVHSRKARHVTE